MEQKLEIHKNGDYNNVYLKTRVDKKTGEVFQGLKLGSYAIFEKSGYDTAQAIPKGNYTLYRCSAVYDEESVSWFFTRDDEAEAWNEAGGVGDKVKVTAVSIPYTYNGDKKTRMGLSFEVVA